MSSGNVSQVVFFFSCIATDDLFHKVGEAGQTPWNPSTVTGLVDMSSYPTFTVCDDTDLQRQFIRQNFIWFMCFQILGG